MRALLIPILALPVFSPGPGDKDERLREAATKLEGTQEASIREGAELCLKINSAESIELLLRMLKGENPHFRDIVWEVLGSFKEPYARRIIEMELEKNTRDPELRAWCADLLGRYRDGIYAKTLEKSLADKSLEVRRQAARSLGKLEQKGSMVALTKAAKEKDAWLRANAIESLARIDAVGSRALFFSSLKDPDGGARCALLGALPEIYPENAETHSTNALSDPDWRPRMQAVENLAQIKTKSSFEALIRACGDGRPVVAEKALATLAGWTGKHWASQDLWQKWWDENKDSFEFPTGKAKPVEASGVHTVVTFNKLPVSSDHVAFLIDGSIGMDATLSDGRSKADAARAELAETLKRMEGKLTFNLFVYASDIDAFAKKPVPLDEKSRKAAMSFLSKVSVTGRKDIWNLLATIVEDPTLDTVYLLSSGEPEIGLYVHWNRVTEHLKELNRFHKVVVHTVAYSDSKWYRDQLEKISEATGGKFIFFE